MVAPPYLVGLCWYTHIWRIENPFPEINDGHVKIPELLTQVATAKKFQTSILKDFSKTGIPELSDARHLSNHVADTPFLSCLFGSEGHEWFGGGMPGFLSCLFGSEAPGQND